MYLYLASERETRGSAVNGLLVCCFIKGIRSSLTSYLGGLKIFGASHTEMIMSDSFQRAKKVASDKRPIKSEPNYVSYHRRSGHGS